MFRKRIEIKVDKEYMQLILYQINQHLLLHYANLSCALTRPDVTICDVRLTPAVKCLEYCIDSLGEQVEKLEYNVSCLTVICVIKADVDSLFF